MIVLDSSFLIAYHNTRDVHHSEAARTMVHLIGGEWGRAVLLEYVFLEVVTVLLLRRGHAAALEVAEQLLNSRELDFLPSSEHFLDVLDVFRTQGSGALSFVDAAIVAAARRSEPGFVATFDRDLEEIEGVSVIHL